MPQTLTKKLAALTATTTLLLSGCIRNTHTEHPVLNKLPPKIVWAWERPENFTELPSDIGVAYVATSVMLEGEQTKVRPRAQPLKVRNDTALIPVIHVDASYRHPPSLSNDQRDIIVDQLLKFAKITQAPMIQLDFEARRSQRSFLQEVVALARTRLPQTQALSMTALASWCAGDFWLSDIQADEIVPMAFRMAKDEALIRDLLISEKRFPRKRCQNAIGFATDEPTQNVTVKRRYYFSPVAWTNKDWQTLMQ